MGLKKLWIWMVWLMVTCVMGGILTYKLRSSDRRVFLPGKTTTGHYQIELDCNACHGSSAEPVAASHKLRLVPDTKWWFYGLPTKKLEMGWCIKCHRQNGASQDCLTCHY